jgi:hypothetical protein
VTRRDAERLALASVPPGVGHGEESLLTAWEKVGCVFLGMYTAPGSPHDEPQPFPAYLVQVLADPVPDYPQSNIGIIVVDAVSGEFRTQHGEGPAPFGVMGTTCGVAP